MNWRPLKRVTIFTALLILNACASAPRMVSAPCPEFPQVDPAMLTPPPSDDLLELWKGAKIPALK